VLIPVGIRPDQFDTLCTNLDGIVLTGGVDINPVLYGAPMHPEVTELDPARDETEIALANWLVKNEKPFLGICRGIEVMNVALGGTLYTHISDQLPQALFHPCYGDLPRNLLAHSVDVEAGTRLSSLIGEGQVWVNSLHHQGIRDLAPDLLAVAHAGDGLVEGVEIPGHPFAVGVQWHPEELVDHENMLNLFKALVGASSKQPV
jgi:putative glutamine amidotransferase